MTSDQNVGGFEPGDEVVFHISSLGVSMMPMSPQQAQQTGQVVGIEMHLMHAIFRGETEDHWIVDVQSIQPPLLGTRLLKSGVDLIGVKGQVEAVKRPLVRP